MGKDSGTKCSHCGKNGHNSRTCCEKTMKLFGVKISQNKREDPFKKSFSMGNLQAIIAEHGDHGDLDRGYLSDGGPVRSKKDGHERKKGIPWTIEEHKTFLKGLEKLGKGDWRGISRNFVSTRTPTQVASHAQKYFLRKTAASKKKRRASLFDMYEKSETHQPPVVNETNNIPNQTGTSLQVANQVASHAILAPPTMPMAPASTALPKATCQTIPNFNGIPYMVGGTPGYIKPDGGFSAVSVVPVVCSVGYAFQQKQQNKFPACAPFVAHQSHINAFSAFSPAAGAHCARKVEPHHNLSSVNTDLKLSIAPPDTGSRSELPPHTSVMNGAIGVI